MSSLARSFGVFALRPLAPLAGTPPLPPWISPAEGDGAKAPRHGDALSGRAIERHIGASSVHACDLAGTDVSLTFIRLLFLLLVFLYLVLLMLQIVVVLRALRRSM